MPGKYKWLLGTLLNRVGQPYDQAYREWENCCWVNDPARETELWLVLYDALTV